MGFSLLTLLEVIYHGTLRLCCRSYRKRWENKQNECVNGKEERSKWSENEDYEAQHISYMQNESNNNAGFLRKILQRFSSVGKTNGVRGIEKVLYPTGKIFW